MASESNKMPLLSHIKEIRNRLIWILVVFIATFILGFFLTPYFIDFFRASPAMENIEWHVFNVADAIMIYVKMALAIAFIITLPFILFQIWRFVAPGLTEKEQKSTRWYIPAAFLVFLLGIAFGYFILFPMVIKFLLMITNILDVNEMFGISQYFGFMFKLIIPFGLLFQLPIVVVFLTKIGVISPELLIKIRKYAYLVLVVVGVSITPPDVISDLLVVGPLIALYEISVWLSRAAARKRKARLEAESGELQGN
jgi:sec-independent protein translocase protein TatC